MSARIADVAIIGGGLMGCWTALFLARRGKRVVVVERGFVGMQASGVNFGSLRIQGRFLPQLLLSLRAAELWSKLPDLIGAACDFEQTGHLHVAADEAQLASIVRYAADAAAYGLNPRVIDRGELRRRWPWLSRRMVGGTLSELDGAINPRLVCPAVAAAARAAGVEIVENAGTATAERVGEGFRVVAEGGLAVEAGVLLNMAGAWAPAIAALFGETVPLFAAGPAEMVTEPLPRFMGPTVQAVDGSIVFRQIERGNVLVAGHPRGPADPVARRARMPAAKVATNLQRLADMAPLLAGVAVIRTWSGIEGYLPDMRPVMGPSETCPGLFHAFGFCGHGMQLGPGVGAAMSDLVIDGRTETPLGPFAIGRFRAAAPAADQAYLRQEFDAAVLRRQAAPG